MAANNNTKQGTWTANKVPDNLEKKIYKVLSLLREKFPNIYVTIIMTKDEYVIQSSPSDKHDFFEVKITSNTEKAVYCSCTIYTIEKIQALNAIIEILK